MEGNGSENGGSDDSDPGSEGGGITPAISLFDESLVHTVDITLGAAAQRALNRDGKTYVEAQVNIDGNNAGTVGLRLKGSSSWRQLGQKAGFKVDFNYADADMVYDGYTKINLNNMLNDSTQLHEMLAWEVFEAAGLPSQRCAYAWVTVDGEDYGLYLLLELAEQNSFLDRTYGHHDGRVYEGGYPYYPESWEHADFSRNEAVNFQLEAGEDVEMTDMLAAADVIGQPGDAWSSDVGPFLDIDQYARFQMAEAWTGQWDGYAYAANNFRVYLSEEGQVQLLASGLDWTFTDYGNWGSGSAAVARRCAADATCLDALRTALIEVSAAADGADLLARFDTLQALIQPYVEADPMKETNDQGIARGQFQMRGWLETRTSQLAGMLDE